MGALKVEEIDNYLGKPINDPYGRRLGYVIGFYSDHDGNVTALEVSLGDSEFKSVEIGRFRFDSGEIVLLPEWEYAALMLEERLARLKRRMAALEELSAKKDVPRHSYEVFKKMLEESLAKVKEEVKNVKEALIRRMHELEDSIVELERALTSLKVSYLSGEIPEKAYKSSIEQIRKYLEQAESEKESIKKHLDKIEALENQPIDIGIKAGAEQATQQPQQSQPIPVVVVGG